MEENYSPNENKPRRERRSIFFPLLLLTAGVLLLLSNFGALPGGFWGFIEIYWPVLLIISGLDGLIRGNGITGSFLIAGVGAVLLAGNLGYISLSAWELLVKGWPFILIAAGIDIIIGRHTAIRSVFALIMAFVLIAGVVWIAEISIPGTLRSETFKQEYKDETSLNLEIFRSAGKVELKSGVDEGLLLEAQLNLLRNEQVDPRVEPGENSAFIILGNNKDNFPGTSLPKQNSTWDIRVSSIPEVTAKSVVLIGENKLDFRGMNVNEANCETITGISDIYLSEDLDAKYEIKGATGKITIHAPAGVPVKITANKAISATFLGDGFSEKNGGIVSDTYKEGEPAIEVKTELPIGAIHIVEYQLDL